MYTTKVKFGKRSSTTYPSPFNVWRFFFQNKSAYASLMRTEAWNQVLQREVIVVDKMRFFEDWDTFIRLMGKKWYGLPLADTEFNYRQSLQSLISRSVREYAASIYLTWRLNIHAFIRLPLTHAKFVRRSRRGWAKTSILNPMTLVNYANTKLVARVFEIRFLRVSITARQLFEAVFFPKKFVNTILSPVETQNLAEMKSRFRGKPKLREFLKPRFGARHDNQKNAVRSVIVFHTWWATGGAEIVLLDWIKSIRGTSVDRIIDVCQLGDKTLRTRFSEWVDEQYSMQEYRCNPIRKTRVLLEFGVLRTS